MFLFIPKLDAKACKKYFLVIGMKITNKLSEARNKTNPWQIINKDEEVAR